jgi:diaminopimelate decarboxylase
MDAFTYRDGSLHAEGVPLARIAAEVGTPVFVYSAAAIEAQYDVLAAALADMKIGICYALKANSNQAVIATLAARGAGADVVSEGELRRALAAGVHPAKIVFAGVGKTAGEMRFALETGIHQFNLESEPELELLNEVAAGMGVVAPVAIRFNPDVDAKTHAKITTGKKENKFGIEIEQAKSVYARAAAMANIDPVGVAMHIGSQLTDLAPYRAAYRRMADLVRSLRAEGHDISRVDLGGGIGIDYSGDHTVDLAAYAAIVRAEIAPLGAELLCEPGRLLVGNAGVLLTRTIFVKHGSAKRFVIVDAAMNDLIRPTLYEAYHQIVPVIENAPESPHLADIVGPVCESGDYLAKDRALPELDAGDLLAVKSAGAYGAVMGSSYNTRLLAPEVLVRGDDFAVVRPRPSYEALIGQDRLPEWLSPPQPMRRAVAGED